MIALAVAGMELRQQLRDPVFRIVAGISVLMILGAAAIDALRIDAIRGSGSGSGSGATLVMRVHIVWSLFYLFTVAAFVGEAITRDVASGFAPLLRATPAPRAAYLLGRFGGSTAAVMLCFLSVPAGLVLSRAVPGADPAWLAPLDPATWAVALLVLALPNLFIASALFMLLAVLTRSISGCLVGAVALLTLYGLQAGGTLPPLLEPFGVLAAARLQIGDAAPLLANRLVWLAVALGCVAAAVRFDARGDLGAGGRRKALRPPPDRPMLPTGAPTRRPGAPDLVLRPLIVRIRHHLGQTVPTPVFAALLLLGMASVGGNLWPALRAGAPVTALIAVLIQSFVLVPVVVVLFFAGELHWSDRAHGIDGIVGAAPVPRPVLLLAEVAALGVLLLLLATATGAALALLLASAGRWGDIAALPGTYILPKTYDWLLLAILAWWLQTLSPSKLAGWGYFVLFLIATLGLNQAGLDSPYIHYGRYPQAPLPPQLTGNGLALAFQAAWGAMALALLGLGLARGTRA